MEKGLILLDKFKNSEAENGAAHRGSIELILKVLGNVKANPMEQKMRSLNKSGKAFSVKIGPYSAILQFLSLSGWTSEGENFVLKGFDLLALEASIDAINAHIMSLGASVVTEGSGFDPYKSSVGATETRISVKPNVEQV